MPLPTAETILGDLVATPSMSSTDPRFDQSNEACIARLAEYAESIGGAVEVSRLPGQPHKQNLVVRFGSGEGGLVLSGHSDTVPYDDGKWSSDPFTLTSRDDKLYGLGTADMKGFFAAALRALEVVGPDSLRAPVYMIATADEETGMDGMRALLEADQVRGTRCIIGEPTELEPIRQHKGVMHEALSLTGRAGHASDPRLGKSALDGMAELLASLIELREKWQRDHGDERFVVPYPTLNLGHVHGGDSPNRICGHCEVHVDIRTLPALSMEEVRLALRGRLNEIAARRGLEGELSALSLGVPAFECAPDASLVRASEEITGREAGAVMFATEAPFFMEAGLETIVLGAGSVAQAHQPDEFVTRKALAEAESIYASLVHRFCVDS